MAMFPDGRWRKDPGPPSLNAPVVGSAVSVVVPRPESRSVTAWVAAALGFVVAFALTISQAPQVQVADVAAVDDCAAQDLEGGPEGGPVPSGSLLVPVTTAALRPLDASTSGVVAQALPAPQDAQAYARWMRTVRGAQAPPGLRRAAGEGLLR